MVINDTIHLKKVLSYLNDEFQRTKKIEVNSKNLEKFSRYKGVEKISNILKASINKYHIN